MDFFIFLFAYALLGAFTGLMAGLLGIGGGLVLVPSLVMLFAPVFAENQIMHMALGTSMASIVFTSFFSARAHYRLNNVVFSLVQTMGIGVFVGTLLGTFLTNLIPAKPLAIFYTAFVVFTAINMFRQINRQANGTLPSKKIQTLIGTLIGTLSSIVSIGGGSLIVPFLNDCGLPLKRAIGTSSAIGVILATGGTLGYALHGFLQNNAPYSLGYIYLPALLPLVVASHLTAPLGARLTQKCPVKRIKQFFAWLLVILALKMLGTFF